MMNIVIEDTERNLKVGDMLMDMDSEHLCIVAKDLLSNKPECKYRVKRIDEAGNGSELCAPTLQELTNKVRKFNYAVYSQDLYELVIRRKR